MPAFSKETRLSNAQNAAAIADLTSKNLASTMGLSATALPTLRGAIQRMLIDGMRPRVEAISVEDAAHLYSEDWAPTLDELLRQVAGEPGSTPHWFLTVGVDLSGCVTFQVWPIVHPTLSSHPPMEAIQKFVEFSVLEQFAVLLNMRGLPKAGAKL